MKNEDKYEVEFFFFLNFSSTFVEVRRFLDEVKIRTLFQDVLYHLYLFIYEYWNFTLEVEIYNFRNAIILKEREKETSDTMQR